MKFLKQYWYLIGLFLLTAGLGVMVFLTSQKLTTTKPVAPTVPQVTPKAAEPACTLAFTLAVPTATPTETPGPTATPTPTSTPNTKPDCTGLSVTPSSGNAPLSVTLTCSGTDPDGDITASEFTFGDGQTKTVEKNVGSPGSLSTTYVYGQNGSFSASCRVRDNNATFSTTPDACRKTVTVGGGQVVTTPLPTTPPQLVVTQPTPTPTPPPTPKVPVAGSPAILGATVGIGALLILLGLAL